jgi:AbiU2
MFHLHSMGMPVDSRRGHMSKNPTQLNSIDRLRRGTRILGNQLARANTHLIFFRGILGRYAELGAAAKDFWDYTLTAHSGMAIRDLGVIYDTHRDGINLANLLEMVDVQTLDVSSRQKHLGFVGIAGSPSTDPAVKTLREWRNNIVAHYNEEVAATDREDFWKRNPLDEASLQTLIDKGFEVVEWCSQIANLSDGFPRFAEGKDGYLTVLDSLKCLSVSTGTRAADTRVG